MNKLRDIIPSGYIWANGLPMSKDVLESYNYAQGRINAFISAGFPVPQTWVNESANIAFHHINSGE